MLFFFLFKRSTVFSFFLFLRHEVVCHVELTSGFNTSAVNQLTIPHDKVEGPPKRRGGRRGRRSPGAGGSRFAIAKFMGSRSSEEEGSGGSSSSSSSSEESAEERGDVWTLYGIFQLSDRVMCQSGSAPSLNLCQTDCQGDYKKLDAFSIHVAIKLNSYV